MPRSKYSRFTAEQALRRIWEESDNEDTESGKSSKSSEAKTSESSVSDDNERSEEDSSPADPCAEEVSGTGDNNQTNQLRGKGRCRVPSRGRRMSISRDQAAVHHATEVTEQVAPFQGNEAAGNNATMQVVVNEITWNELALTDLLLPKEENFNQTSGPNMSALQGCDTPLEFFRMLFDDVILNFLVTEINNYAARKCSVTNPPRRRSLFINWTSTDKEEILLFVAIVFNMGLHPRPRVLDYWRTDHVSRHDWFPSMMKRERFQALFHTMLHASSVDAERSEKIKQFFDLAVAKFQSSFYPYKNVSCDESGVRFKGRTKYLRYNPQKPDKWHLQIFSLCCSLTGYLWNAFPDFGAETDFPSAGNETCMTEKVVIKLCSGLRNGHHVYVDRYYTSVNLANQLQKKGLELTGTVSVNRRSLPAAVKTVKLDRFESKFWQDDSQNMTLCAWRDKKAKKNVVVLSTCHHNEVVSRKRKRETLSIPEMVSCYNDRMGGVDRFNQLLGYYSIVRRKTYKWWKKIFFWLLEAFLVNSFILFCTTKNSQMNLVDFKRQLVTSLTAVDPQAVPIIIQAVSRPAPHYGHRRESDIDARFSKKPHLVDQGDRTRDCRVCSNRSSGTRHETRFYCTTCPDVPHLHPNTCFVRYHTLRNYRL